MKVSVEISKVKKWFDENRLTLNYSKSCYLLINKNPRQPISSDFKISLGENAVERSSTTKYLGLCLDENLSRSTHIHHPALKFAKFTDLLYRLRNYVTKDTLQMFYYSLFHSRIQYGITLLGTETETKSLKNEIIVRLNNIVRLMTWRNKYSHVSCLYKHMNILKLNDIY